MLIHSYGMFWERDAVNFAPGSGTPGGYRLLGYRGKRTSGRRIADFRQQTGIYILYDDWGPYYVGLSKKTGIGNRLRDHTKDGHRNSWSRFSWFGFQAVDIKPASSGVSSLKRAAVQTPAHTSINDLEALLIQVLNTRGNSNDMKFKDGSRWEQLPEWDIEDFLPS